MDQERTTLFVDVLLPLHIPDCYTYRVPMDYAADIRVGQRVVVQFGKSKLYSALVRRVHTTAPQWPTKYVLSILDVEPIVSELQFEFWEWMARYYMCCPGDVMAVAIPSAFRLASESVVAIHPDYNGAFEELSENEFQVVNVLAAKGVIPIKDIAGIVGFQKTMPLIKTMIEKHIIVMDEELQQRFTPKAVAMLALGQDYRDEQALRALFERLEAKAATHKQLSVLMKFLQLSNFGKEAIAKKQLTDCKELSASSIARLIKDGVLVQTEQQQSRIEPCADAPASPDSIALNEHQQQAYDYLSTNASGKAVDLLFGVTSSGKTEVYIKLIAQALAEGKQALFLLPEIALTAQIINRLRRYFGNTVGIYHSRFNINERAEVWKRTADPGPDGFRVLVGARSALFLPFHSLGLVVVDEEHDGSYKQYDPAPRYNARDSAIYLAHLWKARTVLGSATPSIESYFNAQNGKYGLAVMSQRYGGLKMPEVLCVDMKDAMRHKEVQLHFSQFLMKHIREALADKKQVILFQNRRGFSLHLECDACHWIPECANCDVSLVYHKSTNSLRCHYCGHSIPVPAECPECHSTAVKMKGFGTEHIEDDLSILFPDARVARMDLDSTQQKKRYLEIINDFEDHNIDILVGTQMVTKGLDFDNVAVVGILSADNLISFPDFRSYERAFQQITQVSGRAGRHGQQGKVIIQSYNPWHQAIRDAMENNYQSMYKSQITERRVFRYPPYYKLVDITLRHRDRDTLNAAAAEYARLLKGEFGNRVMGPEYPSVSRVRNYYIKKIMVRFDRTEPISQGKQIMLRHSDTILAEKAYTRVLFSFDVDPQ